MDVLNAVGATESVFSFHRDCMREAYAGGGGWKGVREEGIERGREGEKEIKRGRHMLGEEEEGSENKEKDGGGNE